ncbi:ATP-binding cassette domain-containing protein [Halorhabdus rudnickae]|uniref:ATP-binding cassette domain-containing protein n=1 Tax=Halorhabdus rudnickae TaxID=1775544 RepID=UPI0014383CAF|nr:ABC transporter ATP-binding protein [Halorhabdus rudnickae]
MVGTAVLSPVAYVGIIGFVGRVVPHVVQKLLGPNGSGKSSLVRAIGGLLEPTTGTVTADGIVVQMLSCEETAQLIGHLLQVEGTTPSATVFDTVLLGPNPHFGWRPGRSNRCAVESVLAGLGIDDLTMQEVPTLSGEQRRTAQFSHQAAGKSTDLW